MSITNIISTTYNEVRQVISKNNNVSYKIQCDNCDISYVRQKGNSIPE